MHGGEGEFFPEKKALTLWTGVFDSEKNVVHGGEGDFSAGKKQVLAGGAVFSLI